MKSAIIGSIVSVILLLIVPARSLKAIDPPEFHSGRVVVKFLPDAIILDQLRHALHDGRRILHAADAPEYRELHDLFSDAKIGSMRPLTGIIRREEHPGGIERIFIAELHDGADVPEVVDILLSLNDTEYAEPDFIGYGDGRPFVRKRDSFSERMVGDTLIPNDPFFHLQWGLRNTGQTIGGVQGKAGADINATPAWPLATGSDTIILAVLDSGIPPSAPDFEGRLVAGYDFVNDDDDPLDDHGHGTNVTSIAAATGNNNAQIAGVDWQAKIMPVKILDHNNFGFYTWWASALLFAADNGADVINMSVGGASPSSLLYDAIQYADGTGAVIVACMMNTDNDTPFIPAAYPETIAVGATNNIDHRAVPFCWGGGSNFGDHIDFVAPGELILGLRYDNPTAVSYWCGTSQATPFVSGTISLMLSINPELTREEMYAILMETAHDQIGPPGEDTEGWDPYFGWGRIDAHKAIKSVITTSVGKIDHTGIPDRFVLFQNYPNPFNPGTTIEFRLSEQAYVTLEVFNILGQRVDVLVDGERSAGTHRVIFDASGLASGVYLYTLRTARSSETKIMHLLR